MSDSPAPAYTVLDGQIDDNLSPSTPASAPVSAATSNPSPTSVPTPPTPALPNPGDVMSEELGDVRPATPGDVAEEDALAAGPGGFPGPGLKRSKRLADFVTRGDVLQLVAASFGTIDQRCRRLSRTSRRQQVLILQLLGMMRTQNRMTNGRIVDMDARVAE